MDQSEKDNKTSPLGSSTSDSALGTMSDFTPEEESSNPFAPNGHKQGELEEDISESDLVVSASMKFALTPSPSNSECNQPAMVDQLIPSVVPSPSGRVPIQVTHQKKPMATPSEEPSGAEADVEDNSVEDDGLVPPEAQMNNVELPDTVSRLTSDAGSRVYLVGTAHFSKESQDDVAKTIRMVQPDIVVVELCSSRTAVLALDEETILCESQSLDFSKVRMILRQHGQVQGILYLLLLSVSAHITKQLGMAPGGEFRTAVAEARRSAHYCMISLGDRPIQITLSRALASLSVWQKIKLMWHILASNEPISKEEVEKCKQRDFIEEMLAEMTGQFPGISEVFVTERDIFLTKSLQNAAKPVRNPLSPTGFSPRVVVGVVGIGHVPGIVERWGTVTDQDIPPIMSIPPPSLSNQVIKITLKVSVCGLVGFGIYKCLPSAAKESIYSTIGDSITSVSKYITK